MSTPCPCCGQQISAALPVDALRAIPLGPVRRAVLDALIDAYPAWRTSGQIIDVVYGGDPNGGPDSALNCVSVQMYRIRKRIEPLGWTTRTVRGRGGAYVLCPMQRGRA